MESLPTDEPDDRTLVAAMVAGDREAVGLLYDRHVSTLMAVACRMLGDRREAEDLIHDVFLEIWHKAAAYDPDRSQVLTWMLLRLRCRALDRLRIRSRTAPTAAEELLHQTPAVGLRVDPSDAPDRRIVRRALSALPEKQRVVLELGYFQGLSTSEIAEQINIPLGTVKSRVAAGLRKLRAGLADEVPRG